MWMALDGLTVLEAAVLAVLFKSHAGLFHEDKILWSGALIRGRSMPILLLLLFWYALWLIIFSRRLNLYHPRRLQSFLLEQRLSVEACLTSGLLLTGTLYLIHAADIPRSIVVITVGLVTATLSLRRFVYRLLLYRGFKRGVGTRNVLIVGTGHDAEALRNQFAHTLSLGYVFKGFVSCPGEDPKLKATSGDIVCALDSLFLQTRKCFVDEIFFATTCDRCLIEETVELARAQGVSVRMIPDLYSDFAPGRSVEYVGQFPTIAVYNKELPEIMLFFKRMIDIVMSGATLIILLPFLVLVAIAVKMDSVGPVFYSSERIGKKGRVFCCIKFRTMVKDAERQRSKLMGRNERKGVLFKLSDDPRVTRLGRMLRKYSVDELPQLFNVLRGDMSIVGPRPPLGSEVKEYKLSHLRRLDVLPGLTGLWQVQARRSPSFETYVSLDVAYIENWSLWLDLKIICRTIGVVLAGTGT